MQINYREAENKIESCEICRFYDNGFCSYNNNIEVDDKHICDWFCKEPFALSAKMAQQGVVPYCSRCICYDEDRQHCNRYNTFIYNDTPLNYCDISVIDEDDDI